MIDPVVVDVFIKRDPATAFELFTGRIADWWPLQTHSLGASREDNPVKTVILEPHVGGRIYEIAQNGLEEPWGAITDWQPGEYVAFTWHVGRDPEAATRVSVRFQPSDTGGTHIKLTHDNWHVLGDEGSKLREGYAAGWHGIFNDEFVPYAEGTARVA